MVRGGYHALIEKYAYIHIGKQPIFMFFFLMFLLVIRQYKENTFVKSVSEQNIV